MSEGLKNFNYIKKRMKESNITFRTTPFDIVEKELKVLKIIKEKDVDIQRLMKCINVATYNNGLPKNRQLTQEEFDLLRSVLGE